MRSKRGKRGEEGLGLSCGSGFLSLVLFLPLFLVREKGRFNMTGLNVCY